VKQKDKLWFVLLFLGPLLEFVCPGARLCPATIAGLVRAQEEKDEEGRAADDAADSK